MLQRNAVALMRHTLGKKWSDRLSLIRTVSEGRRPAPLRQDAGDESVQMTETRIYIGLNDAETKEQKYDTEQYLSLLKGICRDRHLAFSVDVEEGGYYHEDGEYTEETSLVLILLDADRETVREIAKDLRSAFRQESVLVTEDVVRGCFIFEES